MSVIAVSISPHRSFRAVRGPTSAPQMSTHRVSGFPQYSSHWFPWKRPLWTTLGLFKSVFFFVFLSFQVFVGFPVPYFRYLDT